MGIKDDIGDTAFDASMQLDAQNLGGKGTTPPGGTFTPDWNFAFKKDIHGELLQPRPLLFRCLSELRIMSEHAESSYAFPDSSLISKQ